MTELKLVGAGGEPVDLRRTIASHGVADLPPNRIDEEAWTLELTLRRQAAEDGPGFEGRPGYARLGEPVGEGRHASTWRPFVRRSRTSFGSTRTTPFYEVADEDPDLSWVDVGSRRLLRARPSSRRSSRRSARRTAPGRRPCAWSRPSSRASASPATEADGPFGRAFRLPQAMARKTNAFYSDTVRAGYRGAYLRALSRSVASGRLDLESLAREVRRSCRTRSSRAPARPARGRTVRCRARHDAGRPLHPARPRLVDTAQVPAGDRSRGAKDTTIERRFRATGRTPASRSGSI